MGLILQWIAGYGYAALFMLLMLGIVGVPGPDEIVLLYAGHVAWQGKLGLAGAIVAAALGSMCGITVSYLIGRYIGLPTISRWGRWVHITEASMARVRDWFERWGRWTLVFAYFVPGVRHVTAIVSGASRLSWHRFAPFAYSGALLWSATFILAGYLLGGEVPRIAVILHRYLLMASTFVVALLLALSLAWWAHTRRQPDRRRR
jgi:membrane protein DedA with SNARE-associated domain